MAALTVADADAILKESYDPRRPKFLGYKNASLLALMPKKTNFKGREYEIPLHWGGNQGASRSFAKAKTNKSPGKYSGFFLRRKQDYATGSISTEAILASEGDEAAFLSMATAEVDNTVRTASRNLAISLTRNHGGARGRVASVASDVITLTNAKDVSNFEVDMKIQRATTDGTSGSVAAEITTIVAIDRRAGTLTVADDTNFATNNYLFRDGDFGLSLAGLPSWIPSTAPTSGDNFFGVDRSVDSRLYGVYQDFSSLTINEALRSMDTILTDEGAEASHAFLNPYNLQELITELDTRVVYDMARPIDMPHIGFKSVVLQSVGGQLINVVADRTIPYNEGYVLQLDDWQLCTLGDCPRVLESMGNKFIWDVDGDSIEVRVGFYGELGCRAPGHQGRFKIA
jgi:hypothetical protein